jgi:hypothetical protein
MQFANNDDARAWADGWIRQNAAAGVLSELLDLERENAEIFDSEYGRFASQFDVEYGALARLIDELNFVDRSCWPRHRFIQYVLLAYNLPSFSSALDRYRRGYYADALALVRGLYETFLRMVFVSCNREEPWGALGKAPKGVVAFNATGLVRDHLKLPWLKNYSVTSAFTHSNTFLVSEALIRAEQQVGEPERIGLKVFFDRRLAELVGPLLSFTLLLHLRFAVDRLTCRGELQVSSLPLAQEAVGLLTYGLESHEKEYWTGVASDLEFLFELLAVADDGGDWRELVRMRPGVEVAEEA